MPALPKTQLALLILGWAAAAAIVAALVANGRSIAFERSERATAAFAAILDGETARTFQAAHLTLAAIADAHDLMQPARHDAPFRAMMARRLEDLPFVRAIFVVDPEGRLAHDTSYPGTPDLSFDDRDYFLAHRDDAALGRSIGPPLASRSGMGWFIPVTQRLRGPEFRGVVVAAVQADSIQRQFESFGLGEGDVLALFHASGVLVARHPIEEDAIGKSYRPLDMFADHLPRRPAGTFRTRAGMIPGENVVSYRTVENAPFVVRVGRTRDAVLGEWQRTAIGAAVAMGALTILLAFFAASLVRQRARRALRRERRMQAEKLEALGRLTGGIAHDFGNILNVVALNVELLRDRSGANAQASATANRALARGRDLIARLLAFGRRRPLQVAARDLNEVIESSRALLQQAAGGSVEIVQELTPGLPRVMCDAGELEIALLNLVVNARDAMKGAGRIRLGTGPCAEEMAPSPPGPAHDRQVCLVVEDSGPGMSGRVRRRAFEPFYTTKGEAGTGLGLPQVYGFMQQLGGDVRIVSAPGKGTAVHLLFPIARDSAEEKNSAAG